MPGFDRTGPEGRGPLTGGGRGYCGQKATGFSTNRGLGRGGAPRGGGMGRCWGNGMGRQFQNRGFLPNNPVETNNQADIIQGLQEEIHQLNQKVEELMSLKSKE